MVLHVVRRVAVARPLHQARTIQSQQTLNGLSHQLSDHVLSHVHAVQSFRTDHDFLTATPFMGALWTGAGICREMALVVCHELNARGYQPVYHYHSNIRAYIGQEGAHAFVSFEKNGSRFVVDPTWRQFVIDTDKPDSMASFAEHLRSSTSDILIQTPAEIAQMDSRLEQVRRFLHPDFFPGRPFALRHIVDVKTFGVPYRPHDVDCIAQLNPQSLRHLALLHQHLFGSR